MRHVLLAALLALTGCATYNIPPNSEVSTDRTEAVEGSMGVVLGALTVEDTGGLAAHVGPGSPDAVYRAFLAEHLPGELTRQSTLEEAFVGEAEGYDPILEAEPAGGTTLVVDGKTPDWVLILRSVTLLRAKYSNGPTFPGMPGQPAMGGGETRAVRNDVEIVLWDNRVGSAVARGEVESEETYMFAPSSGTFAAAVGEFVEKLIENVPLRERR